MRGGELARLPCIQRRFTTNARFDLLPSQFGKVLTEGFSLSVTLVAPVVTSQRARRPARLVFCTIGNLASDDIGTGATGYFCLEKRPGKFVHAL